MKKQDLTFVRDRAHDRASDQIQSRAWNHVWYQVLDLVRNSCVGLDPVRSWLRDYVSNQTGHVHFPPKKQKL